MQGISSLEALIWIREKRALVWWQAPDRVWVFVQTPNRMNLAMGRSLLEAILNHEAGHASGVVLSLAFEVLCECGELKPGVEMKPRETDRVLLCPACFNK